MTTQNESGDFVIPKGASMRGMQSDVFMKPEALLYFAPKFKVSVVQRRVINCVFEAATVDQSCGGVLYFDRNALCDRTSFGGSDKNYLLKACLDLRAVEAWINPFKMDEAPVTSRIFENVSLQRGGVVFELAHWAFDCLMSDKSRVAVPICANYSSSKEAQLAEICAFYSRKGMTPSASKQYWAHILQIDVSNPEGTRWFGCALKKTIERVGEKLGISLEVVKNRNGVAFKIQRLRNKKVQCRTRQKCKGRVSDISNSADQIPGDVLVESEEGIEAFSQLLEKWNVLTHDAGPIGGDDFQCQGISKIYVKENQRRQAEGKGLSSEAGAALQKLTTSLEISGREVMELKRELSTALERQRKAGIDLIVAMLIHYDLNVSDLFREWSVYEGNN